MEINEFSTSFRLPYNIKSPTAHAISYICILFSLFPYMNPILAIDTLFMSISLHICVLFKDLQGEALNIEFGKLYKDDLKSNSEFLDNIRSFVQHHNQIIDLVGKLQDVFGGIFVVQYIGAIFSLCSQGYLFTLVRTKLKISLNNILIHASSSSSSF